MPRTKSGARAAIERVLPKIAVPSAGEPAMPPVLTPAEKEWLNASTDYAMGDTWSSRLFPLIDKVLLAREEAMAQELLALKQEVERLTGCLTRANAGFEEYERKWYLAVQDCDELCSKLAALSWRPITETDLPKVGDEVLCCQRNGSACFRVMEVTEFECRWSAWKSSPHTHFRPINAPEAK